jgi:hypothetical protein
MTARPWHKPAATAAPPTPLGDLILNAINTAAAEATITADYRAGRKHRSEIDRAARAAQEAQDAAFRRLRELHPEEIGGGS